MNIQDIVKNQDILDCWKEIQKMNIVKNISKEMFEYDIEEYHTFLYDEIIEASTYINLNIEIFINEILSLVKNNKQLVIDFTNERLSKKIPFSSPLSYEELSSGYTEEELGLSYQELFEETNVITDIGVLISYLIDLIFLFKYPEYYIEYLAKVIHLSEVHIKEFIEYEKKIIKKLLNNY